MTERRERDRIVAASETDIDALFRPLARGVGQAVRRRCRDGVTPLCRVRVMADVDRDLLPPIFGRWPNDEPAGGLLALVAGRAREARAAAVGVQLRRLFRILPVDVRRAVGAAGAKEGW